MIIRRKSLWGVRAMATVGPGAFDQRTLCHYRVMRAEPRIGPCLCLRIDRRAVLKAEYVEIPNRIATRPSQVPTLETQFSGLFVADQE